MGNINHRISLLNNLKQYLQEDCPEWQEIKERAHAANAWFEQEFIDLAVKNIIENYLQPDILGAFAGRYPEIQQPARTVGVVMAGNIPLVGFHDFLCTFLSGQHLMIKPSSKDEILITQVIKKMQEWDADIIQTIKIAERLIGCDAYIATGSNNSGRYFEYYFRKFPSIIRKNRTSLAILHGDESEEDLEKLADDCLLYFGLGCRNVTSLMVPEGYDFVPFLQAFRKYEWMKDHAKFRNNFDYQLALSIMNNEMYMTNEIILLRQHSSFYSPISVIHYQEVNAPDLHRIKIENEAQLQQITAKNATPFGTGQSPAIDDFADGIDTMQFLTSL